MQAAMDHVSGEHWLLIAFISPAAWAIACLVDVCLIDREIYRKPVDGVIVSGTFFAVPVMFLLPGITADAAMLVTVDHWEHSRAENTLKGALLAMLAGSFYMLHLYFYFKTLFVANDVSNAEIFNLLSVLVVPVLAFMLMGEHLGLQYYGAIALAGVGVLVMARQYIASLSRKAGCYIALSVVFISLSMVIQAMALENAPASSVSAYYLLAGLCIALVLGFYRTARRHRMLRLLWRFGALFAAVELLETLGILASQLAIKLSPSVSLVAVIECALPLLVITFSAFVLWTLKFSGVSAPAVRHAIAIQVSGCGCKCVSIALIATAIFLVEL